MVKFFKQFPINKFLPVSFILLSGLFVSEDVFSKDSWNRDFTTVTYDHSENSITIDFVVFDYYFMVRSSKHKHAYLSLCDFYFKTSSGKKYIHLMRAKTEDQQESDNTGLGVKFKQKGTNLNFLHYVRLTWLDEKNAFVYAKNRFKDGNDKHPIAIFSVKWILGDLFKDVTSIRVNGIWTVKGSKPCAIENVTYNITKRCVLKSTVHDSEINRVKVTSKADAIVITEVENGENIKVYNIAGVELQSSNTNRDVVNIKLPAKQIYFVQVGNSRYKVAM